jgi:DNA (cytosine-5)-methyltransferase 1
VTKRKSPGKSTNEPDRQPIASLTTIGLFAGIAGVELGMQRAGHQCLLLCEIDSDAQAVLRARFPNVRLRCDIRKIKRLPAADVWTAGFPCKDLSPAGLTKGIGGRHSGLVQHVFRLLPKRGGPTWLLFENVPFMLQLDGGRAMRWLVKQLEKRGFKWAYRVIDSRCFGLPQRRRRVVLLASRTQDPRTVLLGEDAGMCRPRRTKTTACGFYWTEGNTGLGWAIDAIPTLKGGSDLGIPSPPAIWSPREGLIGTPDIRDAERLQGFPGEGRKDAEWSD